MSAICVVPLDDCVVFAGDGGAYDPTGGNRIGSTSKVFLVPHLNCIFGYVGIGGLGHLLLPNIEYAAETFDDLVNGGFVKACREAFAQLAREGRNPDGVRATAIVGGFSDARQSFEVYKVHSAPKQVMQEGVLTEHAAWKLHPVLHNWASSSPSPEAQEKAGLSGPMNAIEYAARMIAANRLHSGEDEYGVGSFLQIAIVSRDGVRSWIAHRWPDPLGAPIDPNCGDLLPPDLRR